MQQKSREENIKDALKPVDISPILYFPFIPTAANYSDCTDNITINMFKGEYRKTM